MAARTRSRDKELFMEDVRLIFKNFKGKEGPFNREGDRSFCILLDEDLAKRMDKDGWNVKALRAREEGDPDQPYIQVSVKYEKVPPQIYMITGRGRRTLLDEDSCEVLDYADIETVDLILNPYEWNVNGKTGTKAYLKSMYITIREDALQRKYADIDLEEVPTRSGRTVE
jgi:hypothetical protein